MADFFAELDDERRAFIEAQRVFFVATAPPEGRINLSPKGMDTFRVLDRRTVAYLDLTGSGNETAAHIEHEYRARKNAKSIDGLPVELPEADGGG